jgi:hypothetical protein
MLDAAENLLIANLEETPQSPRRRKPIIEDGRIWSDRDHLVWLLEVTWPDVGGRLPRIKSPTDVLDVLQAWHGRSNNYIVETLLRKESSPATATILNQQRRQLGSLHKESLRAWEYREKCRESLEVAERALSPQLSERDKAIVEEQRTKRAAKLAQADELYAAAKNREDKLDKLLKEGEAYFARTEFTQFCQSRRYRLTAVNTANALAGLPFIGWRQASLRCAQQRAQGANGGAMQVFDTIRRIVASSTRKSLLVKHAEQWLKAQRGSKSFGVTELKKDFYYLRSAIETVLKSNPRGRDLPYAIAKEYRERKSHISNVDILFAEDEAL